MLGTTPGLSAPGDDGVARDILTHSLSVGTASPLIGISLLLCQPLTSMEFRT